MLEAYLLFIWGGQEDVIHQDWDQLGHSVYTGSVGTIRSRTIDDLALLFGLINPTTSYRVYDVEYT